MSACAIPISDEEFVSLFKQKAYANRIPTSGSYELTHRCNLKCVHCYLGDQTAIRQQRQQESSTSEVKRILDELAQAGVFSLCFTGGDPMVRRDFAEIYTYTVKLGILVTVFCDGILIDEDMIELFRQYPPREIEISMYGATAGTYEKITQVRGSFQRFQKGIQRLHDNNIRFKLKTVLLTINKDELQQMQEFAEQLGVGFHYDSAIFPCLPHADNGGCSNTSSPSEATEQSIELSSIRKQDLSAPIHYRVEPKEIADLDLSTEENRDDWTDLYHRQQGLAINNPSLYTCGAGKTNFHIDPYARLSPCLVTTGYEYDLSKGSFKEGWYGKINRINEKIAPANYECNNCDINALCAGCPALFDTETGSEDIKSSYICQTTHERYAGIRDNINHLQSRTENGQ